MQSSCSFSRAGSGANCSLSDESDESTNEASTDLMVDHHAVRRAAGRTIVHFVVLGKAVIALHGWQRYEGVGTRSTKA